MKFKIDTVIPKYPFEITHDSKITLLGSCFSDEIAQKLNHAGWNVCSNPFGTIFHPSPLSECILGNLFRVFKAQNSNYYSSWSVAHSLKSQSEEEFRSELIKRHENFQSLMKELDVLFVTFGTSFGYRLKEDGKIAANCHKEHTSFFEKELTEAQQMIQEWEVVLGYLKELNPTLKIVCTISPVRHIKDGVIENNFSKARLFELVGTLLENENVYYFPSYEIVIDELRDYRFYKKDLVHPNDIAVEYVWEHFAHSFFTSTTKEIVNAVSKFKEFEHHRIVSNDQSEISAFKLAVQEKKTKLLKLYPNIQL